MPVRLSHKFWCRNETEAGDRQRQEEDNRTGRSAVREVWKEDARPPLIDQVLRSSRMIIMVRGTWTTDENISNMCNPVTKVGVIDEGSRASTAEASP